MKKHIKKKDYITKSKKNNIIKLKKNYIIYI